MNRLCRDCYYHLRQLSVISRCLTSTATATLVHAFVTSRLDYCSTLYVGLPAVRLGCLERVIRTAARLIGGIPRTGHVSAYMLMYSTGCPSNSGSYFVLVPWSGGVSWVLFRLHPISLLPHPGHQRWQFTPLIGTWVTRCPFCSYLHNPGPCTLGDWPLCVEWASFVATIAPRGVHPL